MQRAGYWWEGEVGDFWRVKRCGNMDLSEFSSGIVVREIEGEEDERYVVLASRI